MSDIRRLAEHTVFTSSRFSVAVERFATPDGEIERAVMRHPGAVAILASTQPGTVLLVRQYRYPVQRWTLELPAGTRVPGEAPEATAQRELGEEAGFAATGLEEICRFHPAIGVSDEELIIYRATGLSPVPCAPECGELVRPEVVALADVPRLAAEGLICDAKTLIGLGLLREDVC